jgi:hypothetical protein
MDDTLHKSHPPNPPNLLIKTQQRFHRLRDHIFQTLNYTKDAIHLGLASATDAPEIRTTKRLLRDVGRASSPSERSEGNVRLHELCEACTLFSQQSVTMSWLDDRKCHSDWPPQECYRLCTVAHLRRSNGHCHLCTALYYFVSQMKSFGTVRIGDKSWLYLDIVSNHKPWEHGSVQLTARLSPGGHFVKTFDLCLLAGM